MRFMPLLLSSLLLAACAHTQDSPSTDRRDQTSGSAPGEAKPKRSRSKKDAAAKVPEPGVIQIKLGEDAQGRPQTESRPIFNIAVGKSMLALNGTPVQDVDALRAILSRYRGLVLTVAAHRCLESERAAEILSLAQQFTTIPVTYGAFGQYGDDQCD